MSKQRPDGDKIANELAGASGFFKPRTTQPSEDSPQSVSDSTPEIIPATPVETRTPVRPVRVAKRVMIRHPFELYMDQIDRLRDAAQVDRQNGGTGSMSKMVRDAIDHFLNSRDRSGSSLEKTSR